MDTVDTINVVMVTVIGIATIVGLVKGLLRQMIELVGIVASFVLAMIFAGWLAETLRLHTPLPYSPSLVVAFVALFVGGIIASHLIAMGAQKVIRMTFMGWFDRLCGAAVGLIVGLIIASLLVSLALELPISTSARGSINDSSVCVFVRPIAPRIFNAIFSLYPGEFDYDAIFRGGGPI